MALMEESNSVVILFWLLVTFQVPRPTLSSHSGNLAWQLTTRRQKSFESFWSKSSESFWSKSFESFWSKSFESFWSKSLGGRARELCQDI